MRRTRIYVDTSVFGGVCDEEFAQPSRRFFERIRRGEFVVVVSRMVLREIRAAPEKVQQALTTLRSDRVEYVEVNDEIEALANAYIAAGVLGTAARDDAVHVAAATVAGASVVLSWNFKHVVNYDRIRKYNAVNLLEGYQRIEIHSPMEMTYGDEE